MPTDAVTIRPSVARASGTVPPIARCCAELLLTCALARRAPYRDQSDPRWLAPRFSDVADASHGEGSRPPLRTLACGQVRHHTWRYARFGLPRPTDSAAVLVPSGPPRPESERSDRALQLSWRKPGRIAPQCLVRSSADDTPGQFGPAVVLPYRTRPFARAVAARWRVVAARFAQAPECPQAAPRLSGQICAPDQPREANQRSSAPRGSCSKAGWSSPPA